MKSRKQHNRSDSEARFKTIWTNMKTFVFFVCVKFVSEGKENEVYLNYIILTHGCLTTTIGSFLVKPGAHKWVNIDTTKKWWPRQTMDEHERA